MKKILMASLLATLAAGASAQVSKVYAGGAIGWAKIPLGQCNDAVLNCKDNGTGYKVYIGYDDTAKIAGELGYINFGKSKIDSDYAPVFAEVKATAATLALAFRHQFAPAMQGVLRVGGASVSYKETSNFGFASEGRGWNVYGGLGLEYELIPGLRADLSLDLTKGGADNGDGGTLYLISAGMQYHF